MFYGRHPAEAPLNTPTTDAAELRGHASPDFSFNRKKRLLTSNNYKSVFDNNDFRASHKNALMLAQMNQQQLGRLGLVISKKNVRLAVDRNRIKRIIREQFRLEPNFFYGLDIVFMARPGLSSLKNHDVNELFELLANTVLKQQDRKRVTQCVV